MKRKADGPARRKGYTKRARTTTDYKMASVARSEVRKEIRKKADWLYTDVSGSGGVSNAGTFVNLLTSANRGLNGINGYSGNTINPSGLRLKYYWSTDQAHNSVRVLLFQWFDATVPALNGLLQSTVSGQATLSPMLTTNLQYIKVLYDGHHMIAPTAADGGSVLGSGTACADVYIPGKRLKQIKFNSTYNTVQDGCLYMLLLSDDSVLNFPQCTYYARLTFTD
jgi:dienelactone hydrolase